MRVQGLGQHDAVGSPRHDRHQILQSVFSLQRVDANPDLLGTTRVVFQVLANHAASHGQTLDGHRIFQIKNERVGLGTDTFGHFFVAVARDKQQRSQQLHRGWFRSRALILTSTFASPRPA